jgi:hypothetical protein
MWRARFGRGFGPVVRQTTKLINEVDEGMSMEHWWYDTDRETEVV